MGLLPEQVVSLVSSTMGTTPENAEWGVVLALITLILGFILPKLLQMLTSSGPARGKVGKNLLILGDCSSGKTALYYRLKAETFPKTVTSIEPLEQTFPIQGVESTTERTVVDFPGHARLRGSLPSYLRKARGIIFMIDSSNTARETIREVADFLYDVFAGCIREGVEPNVLLVCNKSDKDSVASKAEVKRLLEKDLNELKKTRHSLEVEGDESGDIMLGSEDQDFDIEIDAGCQVSFCTASVKSNKMEDILDFIDEIY